MEGFRERLSIGRFQAQSLLLQVQAFSLLSGRVLEQIIMRSRRYTNPALRGTIVNLFNRILPQDQNWLKSEILDSLQHNPVGYTPGGFIWGLR